ncbi:MAG: alternative ribosome rescue aminoacyl-tRNA hydrolase ArfB [Patescibacteria group bacterium]|nr:alternative ribosome rescue aminoacyl-tRNA hydrolase ArfB [Patescibacteria group bacterium]
MNPFGKTESNDDPRSVPESELQLEFVRSSGKGGQNVNKVSTKAQLHWNLEQSATFSPEEKDLIHAYLVNRINDEGEVFLTSQETRSQDQNRALVIESLNRLVTEALTPRTKRVATKPTFASRERRLETKKHQAEKKRLRKIED